VGFQSVRSKRAQTDGQRQEYGSNCTPVHGVLGVLA
jgi:hypothetical protein